MADPAKVDVDGCADLDWNGRRTEFLDPCVARLSRVGEFAQSGVIIAELLELCGVLDGLVRLPQLRTVLEGCEELA